MAPAAKTPGLYLDGGFGVGTTHLLAALWHRSPGPKYFGTFMASYLQLPCDGLVAEVLGNEVDQKGSLVAPEKLRFDFSHKAGLSDAELEKVEKISSDYIRQDSQVYAKEVPLATAREINGLRAVFGETYPDPVRVVSVGVPVEDLIADPKKEAWEKLSIEFCGGTHVLKTGEIKELVILEESGIAKGIRRIIAVTGQEAYDVQRVANEFSSRLDTLEKLAFGPQKENDAKRTQVDLNNLTISALTKSSFRDRMAKISKSILDEQKAAAKAEQKKVLDSVTQYFEDESKKFLVQKVDDSSNVSKTISDVVKTISGPKSALKDRSLYLFAASPEEGKVVHGCYVSEVCSLMPIIMPTRLQGGCSLTKNSHSRQRAATGPSGPVP